MLRDMARPLTIFLAFVNLVVAGCATLNHAAEASDDRPYRALADEFLAGYLAWRPQEGVSLGLHEYDGKVTDLSRASIDREHARLTKFREQLGAIESRQLSRRVDLQRRMLLASIDGALFD